MQKKYPLVIFSTQTAILRADLVVLCSPIFFFYTTLNFNWVYSLQGKEICLNLKDHEIVYTW